MDGGVCLGSCGAPFRRKLTLFERDGSADFGTGRRFPSSCAMFLRVRRSALPLVSATTVAYKAASEGMRGAMRRQIPSSRDVGEVVSIRSAA